MSKASGDDVLIFLSSTAHHKFEMYRRSAEDNKLRIHILPVEMLNRSMAEGEEKGGSTVANAHEKNSIAYAAFNDLSDKKRKTLAVTISNIITELKLSRPEILLATDDAAVSFDRETWEKLPKSGTTSVLENFHGLEGPAAEFGPFVGARGGTSRFLNDLKTVARKNGEGKYIAVYSDITTLTFQAIHLNTKKTDFTFSDKIETLTADSLSEIVFENGNHGIKPHTRPIRSRVSPSTIADIAHQPSMGEDLLHRGQRSAIIRELANKIDVSKGAPSHFIHSRQKLKVAIIGNIALSRLFEREIYNTSHNVDVLSYKGDRLEELISGNDGFVIACGSKTNPKTHVGYALVINSLIVAKQTDGRDFNKPIVLVDIGEGRKSRSSIMGRIANIHKSIAGMGMAKEGEYAKVEHFPGATLYHSNYFCYMCARDQKSANNALKVVLERGFNYYRATEFRDTGNITQETRGADINPSAKTIAIMCSAANQNDDLYKGSYEIAKFIASQGYNVSDGAMDKYMGEAIIKGFQEGREIFTGGNPTAEYKPVLIGVSTPVLLDRETARGKINDAFDVKITTPTLTRRTGKILKPLDDKPADIVTILPGGIGTLVEKIQANLDNNGSKKVPIIVWNPPFPSEQTRFYDVVLKNLCPIVFNSMYSSRLEPEQLLNTKNKSDKARELRQKTGVYVVNSIDEYRHVFTQLCAQVLPESQPTVPPHHRH